MKAVVETSATPTGSHERLPPAVIRLGWVSFFTDVSSEMIVPLLPAFLTAVLGAPALAIGWIEGVAETTASFVRIVSGRLADARGRRKPLVLLGYGLSTFARPLIGLATSWPAVLLVRFADRIGKGVRSAPRDALIAAAAPAGRRGAAFGLHRAFDNAGAVLGPLVASALMLGLGVSIRRVFLLALVPGLVALAILLFGIREPLPAPLPAGVSASAPARPLPAAFWRAAAAIGLFALAASSDAFLLLKAREVGIPAAYLPVLWALGNAVRAALGTWGGGLSDRIGRRASLLLGWSLYAACYLTFSVVRDPWLLLAVFVLYSAHAAFTEGAERALVADLVGPESRGRAFGWLHGILGLAALPASAGFGFVWQVFGSQTAFLAGGILAAAAALALALLVPRSA